MKKTLLILLVTVAIGSGFAQSNKQNDDPALKGNGEVFFLETFDWADPTNERGWSLPEGYYMEDPTDNGFNWHWWGYDSVVTPRLTREPPMESTSAEDGSLCLFLDLYNNDITPRINVDNSIVFPPFDFSSRSSVIVRYETCFMNYDDYFDMLLEITVDDWVHSAQYDVGFGTTHKGRPDKTTPGKPAIFEANISNIVAGMSNVQIKITWRGTSLYWWQIDDFQLSEAYDNDLQLKFAEMEWDDGDEETIVTSSFMFPKSQIGDGFLTNFKSSAINFGEFDQENIYLEVDISKNNQSVFNQTGEQKGLWTLEIDTTLIEELYAPVDFGHYKAEFNYKQDATDDTPENNSREVFFDITDSIYSRGDDSSEESFCYGLEAYGADGEPNIGYIVGTAYPIYNDCEVNSISAFISGGRGDGMIDFRFALYMKSEDGEDPIELTVSDFIDYDSTMIGTWVTLPLEMDGESEFLFEGDFVYACVEYNNMNTDLISHRYENFQVGSDSDRRILDPVSVARSGDNLTWLYAWYVSERNLMIRMNINDHSNIIDDVDLTVTLTSLDQNYPNPFINTTEIAYELAASSDVIIELMDLTGRTVLRIDEGLKTAGKQTATLNADDLESGVYFYTLTAGKYSETKKMVVR